MGRAYDIILDCGCMYSLDGGGGLMPCYAEYGDMNKKEDREQLKLCEKSTEEYYNSKRYKEHQKEITRRNN